MIGNFSITYIIIVIGCILVSLVVHEFMHAYAGYMLGDRTAHEQGRLTLNPLAHIDPVMTIGLPVATLLLFGAPILAAKPVPFDPRNVRYDEFGAAMIAAAGPLTNLVLAFAAAMLARVMHISVTGGSTVLGIFIIINVAIFVFNMIPIPPLDGSRVLYAFAPEPLQRFMQQIEPYGFFIIIALVLTAGMGGLLMSINNYILNFLV
ncbi:MAG: site-2 protease family protein [bacterium]